MNPKYIIALFAIIIFSSCRKDAVVPNVSAPEVAEVTYDTVYIDNSLYDTIFSSAYISAYPGSWWQYSDGSFHNSQEWHSIPIHTYQSLDSTLYITKTEHYLADHSKWKFILDKWNISPAQGTGETGKYELLSEIEGDILYSNTTAEGSGEYAKQNVTIISNVENHDSFNTGTMMFHNVIEIVTSHQTIYTSLGSGPITELHHYFAKDIGLVKIDYVSPWAPYTINLVDYYIAPH